VRLGAVHELLEGRVGLHEVLDCKGDAEVLCEFHNSICLVLAAAVGEEDEGDVVLVEELECFSGAGEVLGRS
jgi:hypothetical protein